MATEIERSYQVDPAHLPELESVPYKDIEQVYFTPVSFDLRYQELSSGEWRVRKVTTDGMTSYTTAVKFGDKASGSRHEIETAIDDSAFGTRSTDVSHYAFGVVRKRRFLLPDTIELDRFEDGTWLAEREFSDTSEAATWQPPDWLGREVKVSNRQLAKPLTPATFQEVGATSHQITEDTRRLLRNGRRVMITLSGMSASGKSTFARHLGAKFDAPIIEADHFHIGGAALMDRYGEVNHDWPHTYSTMGVMQAADRLLHGQDVSVPQYDFETAEPTGNLKHLSPGRLPLVIVEGLYANIAGELMQRLEPQVEARNILVKTPLYVCLLRRMIRDAITTDRQVAMSPEQTLKYMLERAIPTYLEHASPDSAFTYRVV